MEFYSMSEEDQYRIATQECKIQLPSPPYEAVWRDFFLSLYIQVINSEEAEKRRYRERVWDFCVIHSNHPSDQQEAKRFASLLETTLGIAGKTIGDVALGENTLAAASAMVQGSSKVFVLVSKQLEYSKVPKFVFQEELMQQLQQPQWQCKIVPLYLEGPRVRPPFFMANLQGLQLGNDVKTVELVSEAITLEEQMQVRAERQRDQIAFRGRLRRLRNQRLQEIREVIAGLREEYGDDHDPSEQLQQAVLQLNSLTLDGGGVLGMSGEGNQVINMSSCQGINVGPSFHFHGQQRDIVSPSDVSNSNSSSSASPDVDSSLCYDPLSDTSSQPTISTLSSVLSSCSMKS